MREVPADSGLNTLFRSFTDRATNQAELHNEGLSAYLADLLAAFSHRENLYRFREVDVPEAAYVWQLLEQAARVSGEVQQAYYQHAGDYTLFVLGMFPRRSTGGVSKLLHLLYAYTGPRSYRASSCLEPKRNKRKTLEDLSEHFESCVLSLNWVQEYTADPFCRYMLKEFGVTWIWLACEAPTSPVGERQPHPFTGWIDRQRSVKSLRDRYFESMSVSHLIVWFLFHEILR